MNELIAAIQQITEQGLENDRALLKVIEALIDTVNKLADRVSQLEDLHRLEEHQDDLHGV